MMKPISHRTEEPKIVVIGGGTGLSTMLRGLKRYTNDLTAIVTVADDGGGSGVLRDELNMPPPGDIRNCIQALANTESTMERMLSYRFTEGSLKGQCFGNLFLAALNGMCHSFDQAVAKMGEVLAITGRVLPVTNENVGLIADFDDGTTIYGESKISAYKEKTDSRIIRVRLSPERPAALPASLEAIKRAEMIVLGPGSLYTSIIPNLLVEGISEAIEASSAVRVYVLNVMTQEGETENYTASDHIRALMKHARKRNLFEICLANDFPIPQEVVLRYQEQGAALMTVDQHEISRLGVQTIFAPVADGYNGRARHDPDLLACELMKIFRTMTPTRIYR
ncbi:MAG: gluconeogenesis factor YvcK family protein [Oscillospiraceae bacterium]|jgi:uncharacterized cofD-like protein